MNSGGTRELLQAFLTTVLFHIFFKNTVNTLDYNFSSHIKMLIG